MTAKINALVAERVMGWRRGWKVGEKIVQPNMWFNEYREECAYVDGVSDWSPSTYIMDMMRVVEKMRCDGWVWQANNHWGGAFPWSSEFLRTTSGERAVANAESLPLAVCLAALRAAEVSEEEIEKAMEAGR